MTNAYAHRPFLYRAANTLGSLGARIGLEPDLNTQQLLDNAASRTKLDDFGELDFITGFELLVQSLEKEAELNTVGKLSAKTYLHQLLCNRLSCLLYTSPSPRDRG